VDTLKDRFDEILPCPVLDAERGDGAVAATLLGFGVDVGDFLARNACVQVGGDFKEPVHRFAVALSKFVVGGVRRHQLRGE
jgi:hypothetical protein